MAKNKIGGKRMSKKYTEDELLKEIKKRNKEAEKLLNDKDQMERFLERLEAKLQQVPVVGKQLSNLPVLISLVRSYMKKDYQDIPLGTIIGIVSALIYFFAPVDLIPDSIPVLGYSDDAAVFALLWRMVESDVNEYKEWQEKSGKRVIDEK